MRSALILAAALGLALSSGCASQPAAVADGIPTAICAPARADGGRIKRSVAARRAFARLHPCPSTGRTTGACPGYVVDHIVPLACCGADAPENMQWQRRDEARDKDRWERDGCMPPPR